MSDEKEAEEKTPSERDIRIYVLHKVEGYSLRRIAAKAGLTAARIMQIVHEVEPWAIRQLVAESADRMTQKLVSHARYDRIYLEAMRGWRKSLKNRERETSKTGGKFGDSSESMKEGQSGDAAMLRAASEAQKRIDELWGLPEPKQHKHEGHLTGTITHVGQPALTIEQRASAVLDDLRAEIARRGLIIEVPSTPTTGEVDGAGGGGSGDGNSPGLSPPPLD